MPIDISKFTLPELLKHISDLPAAKRAPALKQISALRPAVRDVMKLVYHKNIEFDLPKGAPPFKPLDMPGNWGYNRLPKEIRKFNYFIKGIPNNLTKIQKEKIFIEVLESVSPEEAKLVLEIKEKKLSYKGINRKLAEEAIPEIFSGETTKENV